jgi:hypothetical protein
VHFSVAAWHAPVPEGSATGRILRALCDGLQDIGHTLDVSVWGEGAAGHSDTTDLPGWCTWQPLPRRTSWRMHARALTRPRTEVALAGWAPREGAVALADEPQSFAAVESAPRSCVVVHFAARLDGKALGVRTAQHVQDLRHDRHVARRADLLLAYSDRVAAAVGHAATPVPVAFPVPAQPVAAIGVPIVAMLADWSWAPNRVALGVLLRGWPEVRDAVPGAELVVAGRGDPGIGTLPGVRVVGEVASSAELLAGAAVLAFPCPPTSGPKVKVLEAMALGVPVVTTPAGVEGLLVPGDAAFVSDEKDFVTTLIAALRDPGRRATYARDAHAAVARHHAPAAAATAWAEVVRRRWPELDGS